MITTDIKNPWLGLRSYPEGIRIFGRDKEIVELSQKILYNTQTVIYGKSGIGKSSILNAGVFPILRQNNYFPVYIRLVHDGRVSYQAQVINAVTESLKHLRVEDLGAPEDSMYKDIEGYSRAVAERYDISVEEGLWEFFHRHEFMYRLDEESGEQLVYPVLIFDQFEEIFTLQKEHERMEEFFNELASLLNNICPKHLLQDTVEVSDRKSDSASGSSLIKKGIVRKSTKLDYIDETNVRLVLSLREDYLSYLERNITNIPSLKHNRYCLRPLSEEQAAEIITKPIPGMISLEVAKSIIGKVTGARTDQFEVEGPQELEVDSAILSLFLTELYKKKPKGERCMTVEMVDSLGANIISDFYKEVTSHIPETAVHFIEDHLITEGGRRDNIPLSKALANISQKTLHYLESERLIHEFPWNGEMRVEFMHDILCETISKSRSERIERQEIERRDAALRTMKRRNRINALSAFLLVAGILLYYFGAIQTIPERYAEVKKVRGEYVGVGKLTKKEASYLPYHFVLKKKGFASKLYSSMECRDNYGSLSTGHNLSPYLIPGGVSETDTTALVDGAAEKLNSVCQWEFVRDLKHKRIIQERAYDNKHDLVYAFSYNTVTVSQGMKAGHDKKVSDSTSVKSEARPVSTRKDRKAVDKVIIGSYVDDQGLPMDLLKSGYCFVRITYDNDGYDMLVEYFDWNGNPTVNSDGAYQVYFEYNETGLMTSMSSLNQYGKRMIDKAGNCGMTLKYDGLRRVEMLSVDEFGREKAVASGFSKVTYEYDEHGRETERAFWCQGEPACPEGRYHKCISEYGTNSITRFSYNAEDVPIKRIYREYNTAGQTVYYEETTDTDRLISYSEYDMDGEESYNEEITISDSDTVGIYTYRKDDNSEIMRFEGPLYINYVNLVTYDSEGRMTADAYYHLDGVTPYEDDYRWHKIEKAYTRHGSSADATREDIESTYYYNTSGLSMIEVSSKYPVANTGRYTAYYIDEKRDTILLADVLRHFDSYGNALEEIQSGEDGTKTFNFVNAKTRKPDGSAISLTRYGFPIDESSEKNLRNRQGVFIEIVDNGRNFHGVLLESDSGISYGSDNYSQESFNWTDKVVYLNLTTMKVEEMPLYTQERYWTIYNSNITEEEYQIYQEHYLKYLEKCDSQE